MNNKTHAIITYSKIHYLVTADQANTASMLKKDEERKFDGNLIKGSNISDIVTLDKYYETFPDKRPAQSLFRNDPKLFEQKKFNIENLTIKGLEQLIKGLGKYISSTEQNPIMPNGKEKRWYRGTQEPIELFEKFTKILKQKQNETTLSEKQG